MKKTKKKILKKKIYKKKGGASNIPNWIYENDPEGRGAYWVDFNSLKDGTFYRTLPREYFGGGQDEFKISTPEEAEAKYLELERKKVKNRLNKSVRDFKLKINAPEFFPSKKNKSKKKKFMNLMRNVPNVLSKYLNANELSKLENISIQTKNSIPFTWKSKKYNPDNWYHFFKWKFRINLKRKFHILDYAIKKSNNKPVMITQSIPYNSFQKGSRNVLEINPEGLSELAIYRKLKNCNNIPKLDDCFIGQFYNFDSSIEPKYCNILINEPFDSSILQENKNKKYHEKDVVPNIVNYIEKDLSKTTDKYNLDDIRKIMFDILSGLSECHNNLIVHGNLKGSKIVLYKDKWKLIGFTESVYLLSTKKLIKKATEGTSHYLAPESVLNQYSSYSDYGLLLDSNYSVYTDKIDIWAAGIIFLELASRNGLFFTIDSGIHLIVKQFKLFGTPSKETLEDMNIQSNHNNAFIYKLPKYEPSDLSKLAPILDENAKDLINKMCKINPNERISATEALEHPFFKSIKKNTIKDLYTNLNEKSNKEFNLLNPLIFDANKENIKNLLLYINSELNNYKNKVFNQHTLDANNISEYISLETRKYKYIIYRRIRHTVFFMVKNYITKKINICKDAHQQNEETIRLYKNVDKIIKICQQLSLNQFKYSIGSKGDKEFFTDIVNTLECDIYPFTLFDFELLICENMINNNQDKKIYPERSDIIKMINNLNDAMIIRYYTYLNDDLSKDVELSSEMVFGKEAYSFSTIAFASFIITMVTYNKYENIKPFNKKETPLLEDCIADMLKVIELEYSNRGPAWQDHKTPASLTSIFSKIDKYSK